MELGCGTGELWNELGSRLANCRITLTDLSPGMLAKAKENLLSKKFDFQLADFQNLTFSDNSFDLIISNHNLYHASDLNIALKEISRTLRNEGVFYSTTNSSEHLLGLRTLLQILKDDMWPNAVLTSYYGAENAQSTLQRYFPFVEQRIYQNELRITDFRAIVNYFMSVRDKRVHEHLEQNMKSIEERFEKAIAEIGYYQVFTKVGLFICRKSRKGSV